MNPEVPEAGAAALEEEVSSAIRDRLVKLERLRDRGLNPFVSRWHRSHDTAAALELFAGAEAAGRDRTEEIRLAGRVVTRREQGGLSFYRIRDGAGEIQLMARRDTLGEPAYADFLELDPGDIIGVWGPVFRTRRGEVSLEVNGFRLLSKTLRPFPGDRWHGLRDVETRYRQRYADLIANPAVREVFLRRSRIVSGVRRFMEQQGYVEVETPVLQSVPGGGHARPFRTHFNALGQDRYLRIALELYLKRMVVGGIERVFEIGRVFRNEGLSPRHNPEFTMLESYCAYADYEDVMGLTEGIVEAAATAAGVPLELDYQGERLDLRPPFRRIRMVDAIREATGIDVLAHDGRALATLAVGRGLTRIQPDTSWGLTVNELFETEVQPGLRQPVFVIDYPVETSPLAARREDDPRFVERFELFVAGRELANAFTELNDPIDQRRRFEEQERERAAGNLEAHPFDEDFLRSLEYGMPPTGGLGLGIDRLVMILTNQAAIRDVILFPALREVEPAAGVGPAPEEPA